MAFLVGRVLYSLHGICTFRSLKRYHPSSRDEFRIISNRSQYNSPNAIPHSIGTFSSSNAPDACTVLRIRGFSRFQSGDFRPKTGLRAIGPIPRNTSAGSMVLPRGPVSR